VDRVAGAAGNDGYSPSESVRRGRKPLDMDAGDLRASHPKSGRKPAGLLDARTGIRADLAGLVGGPAPTRSRAWPTAASRRRPFRTCIPAADPKWSICPCRCLWSMRSTRGGPRRTQGSAQLGRRRAGEPHGGLEGPRPFVGRAGAAFAANPKWETWIVGGAQRPGETRYPGRTAISCGASGNRRTGAFPRTALHRAGTASSLPRPTSTASPTPGRSRSASTFVEAMLSGLPVVTTAMGGAMENRHPPQAACWFPPGAHPAALGPTLDELISDPSGGGRPRTRRGGSGAINCVIRSGRSNGWAKSCGAFDSSGSASDLSL